MKSELEVCRKIQLSLLPSELQPFAEMDEFGVFALLQPGRAFGGDFYDFFLIGEDRLCFFIGEFSGKCVPAASLMVVTKSIIRSRAGDDFSTASILTHVNEELGAFIKAGTSATLFLGILQVKAGVLVYSNAGHKPPYFRPGKGSVKRLNRLHGPVLGTARGLVYKENQIQLSKNDMVFACSDGLTTTAGGGDGGFSEKRLKALLSSGEYGSMEDLVRTAISQANPPGKDADRVDDVTVLAAQLLRTPEESAGPKMELTISNSVTENAGVKKHFDTFCEHYDIPEHVRKKMCIVFDELLTNIISYAYRDDKEHAIGIKVELSPDRLKVSMVDDGIPFNPLGVEEPDMALPLEERKIGGLGIHLVRKMMDKVSYRRRIDRNVITVVQYFDESSKLKVES